MSNGTAEVEVAPAPARTVAPPEPVREPAVLDPLDRATPAAAPRAPSGGGPVVPTSLDEAVGFVLRLGAEQLELRLAGEGVSVSRQAFDVDLSRRGLALPGLRLTHLRLTRGADGLPSGGEVRGEISAPFVRGEARLAVDRDGNLSGGAEGTFDVELLGKPRVTFSYIDRQWGGSLTVEGRDLKLPIPNVTIDEGQATIAFTGDQLRGSLAARFHHAALGEGTVDVTITNAGVDGRGGFTMTMPLLAGSHGDFSFADNKLRASLALTAASVQVPVPGLSLTNLTGSVALADGQVSGSVGLTAAYSGLATLTLAEAGFNNRGLTGARGSIEVTAPAIAGSRGNFALDERGRPSGDLTIQSDRIPIPALRRGSITLRLREDGGVDVSGTGRIELGPVGGGDFAVTWVDGVLHLGADVQFRIPPLQPVVGHVEYENGELQGQVSTGVAIGPLSGTILLRYMAGQFSGEGTLAYAMGRFSGSVLIRVDPVGHISGEGQATFRLADWLTGTIGLVVHPDLNVDARGELALPSEITLFEPWRFERNFFHFEQDFPLWGITIPVVGSIGLIASVHANAGFRAAFGPGTLRNVKATGEVSTRPDAEPAFTISGDFNIPAGAEVVLTVGGGIALGALIAKIEGGIDLSGIAGVYGAITLTPTFAYREGQYVLSGTALLAAVAQLRARINAYARVVAGIGWLSGEVWRQDWNLAEWRFDTGWSVGLRAGIDYVLGQPFQPDLKLEPVEVDPQSIIKAAIPNSGEPVPAPPQPPAPQAQFQPTAGAPGAVGAGPPPAGGGPPTPPAATGAPAPAPGASPPPAGAAPPGGGPATPPGAPAAPGAPGAAPAGQTPPAVLPPAAETEPAEDRTVDETYLVYVYDNLQEFFARREAPTAEPATELGRKARERMRRGEPPLPERPPEEVPEPAAAERRPPAPAPPASGLAGAPPAEPPPVPADTRSTGKPLTPELRTRMEEAFQTDLSHVRVHSDERAAEGARQIGAEAYTVGSHVYFGPSREPSVGDAELVAHELTHVVQQEGPPTGIAGRDAAAEREAHDAGRAIKRGERPKPVRKRREADVHRVTTPTPPSPSAPAAPSAGGQPQAGPGGGGGPKKPFTAEELLEIMRNPGDPKLAAAIKELQTREQLWADAKSKVWSTSTKKFVDRPFVRMRFPGPNYLPRKSVMGGDEQLVVGEALLRHGEERTDDKEKMQSKLSRLMYDQSAPANVPDWFTKSAQGTAPIPSFDDVYNRYVEFQQEKGYSPLHSEPDPAPGETSSTQTNLNLNKVGARAMYGTDANPAFIFSGGRWHRTPAAPAGAPTAPGAAAEAITATGQAPAPDVTQATRTVMVADYQAHHVIPLWLESESGKPSGDTLENLAPWHQAAHQTNHAYHHKMPQEITDTTGVKDYRDFPKGTRFIISALEGGNAAHPKPIPAVALSADGKWVPRPEGAIWLG